jgi:DNA adenine methylase
MKYPGGKGKCFQHIINIFPPHTTYIETHLGGGAVLRNKLPASHSIGIDRDEQLIEFWRKNYPGLAEYLNSDAVEFLCAYPFTGTELVYCDPPYLSSTRKRTRVYKHDLSDSDHYRLLDTLTRLPCFVVVSGYASAVYRSKLKSWISKTFQAKAHDGIREECLWANYEIPEQLHDIRYYGANYRERQDFKRRMQRLRRKISQLSRPEQHYLAQWMSDQLTKEESE